MFKYLFADIIGLKDDFLKYIKIETDYLKLTFAEKIVKVATTIVFLVLSLVVGVFVAIMLSFALAFFLSTFMAEWAAFLCTAGAFILFLLLMYLLRRPLIMNPISKAVTRALFKKPTQDESEEKPNDSL